MELLHRVRIDYKDCFLTGPNASLRVVKLRGDRLLVTTRAPILVNAAKFELGAGIEKLREIMGLPNIVGTVPVNFALVFRK